MPDTVRRILPGDDTLTYLALGDSYTIGQSVSDDDRYPAQLVHMLRSAGLNYRDPDIIAVTGWTTGDLLNATSDTTSRRPYHIVSLLIGVNNQYQGRTESEYRIEFTELLQRSIHLAGGFPSHVVVLSIPDYSVTPFARGSDRAYIASQIDSFNAINKEIAISYHTIWLDVTWESRKAANDPSLIAGDSLHFSGKEYAIWAKKMETVIKAM
jgi:lysophospholipase L1-like esterase